MKISELNFWKDFNEKELDFLRCLRLKLILGAWTGSATPYIADVL